MPRLILILSGLLLGTSCLAESLHIEPKHATFTAAIASSKVRQAYTISNTGSAPVAIRDWKAISGVGEVVDLPKRLAAGESKTFVVDLRLPAALGDSLFRFALFTDEADVERYRFTLSGFVYSVVAPERPMIDFGTAEVGPGTQGEVTLSAREDRPLELVRIEEKPEWLDVSIERDTVRARVRGDQVLGLKAGVVRVATNLPQQPSVDINVRAILGGSLTASIYALGFKPTEIGEVASGSLEVAYTGKGALDDLRIELPQGWSSERSACAKPPAKGQCTRVTVSTTIAQAGKNGGNLRFRMADEPELSIPFGVMGLGKGQSIREVLLNEQSATARNDAIDISRMLQEQVAGDEHASVSQVSPTAPTPAPSNGGNVVRSSGSGPVHLNWRAKNDNGIHGYMVYRSEDRAGPFRRVTRQPIPATHETGEDVSNYTFTDPDVAAGKTYYYYIDSLAKNGTQSRLSPVLSKSVTASK